MIVIFPTYLISRYYLPLHMNFSRPQVHTSLKTIFITRTETVFFKRRYILLFWLFSSYSRPYKHKNLKKRIARKIGLVQKDESIKMIITLDSHGPRLILKDCHLPYLPYFSLLSTFTDVRKSTQA
jgi:hypothetical protein